MESQGNGRYSVWADIRKWGRRTPLGLFHALGCWLLCSTMLWMGTAQAQSSNYVYDSNGRVVAVTQNNGASAQYSYDTIGNLTQVSAVAAGQLAIFAFTPSHGAVGAQVLIAGQGFNASAPNNAVAFNGIPTTVLSASSSQLSVTVPIGAATGPISVTTSGITATSATSFFVDSTGLPPTINAVSPSAIAIGASLSVTGANLSPIGGQTVMLLGNRDVSTGSSISNSQIQHTISASDTSGYITVETPYGQAVSPSPIIVLPAGLSAANIISTAYAATGSSANLSIAAGGQTGAVLFDGNVGDWTSLQLSAITSQANNINYAVYAPGNQLISQGVVSSSSPSIHLPRLLVGGTYLATFRPDTAGAQLAVGLESASVLSLGTLTPVATTIQGQSKRLVFQATVKQLLTLSFTNASTNPSGQVVGYTIYNPGQESYITASGAGNRLIDLLNLPSAGTYQLVITPGVGTTATEQVAIKPFQLTPDAQSRNYSGYFSGQNATLTFTASQGDNLELTFSNMSIIGSSSSAVGINVYDANGRYVAGASDCHQGWTCRYPLWSLASGRYTLVVSPPDPASSIGFNLMLAPDILGPVLTANTPATVNLSLGQSERLTFNANAGDSVVLNVSNASTVNANALPVYVSIYRPDVSPITTGNYYTTASVMGSSIINLLNLPVSGTYTVVVNTSGVPGTAQLLLSPIAQQPVVTNGANQVYSAAGPGQYTFMTFNANQGDNLELTLSGVIAGNSSAISMNVYDVNGTNISSNSGCYQAWTCRYPLWNLAAGKYTVIVPPSNPSTTVSFNAMLASDIQGPILNTGVPTTVNLALGQVERLTFNASAGSNATLNLSQVNTTSPSGLPVYVSVYRPDTGAITTTNYYGTFSATNTNTLTLPNLPVSGTYTVVVSTSGIVGSAVIELMPP